MSDLDSKIATLIKDLRNMSDSERFTLLKRFAIELLDETNQNVTLTSKDFTQIHGDAAKFSTDLPINASINGQSVQKNTALLQAVCYSQAFYAYLRRNNLIKTHITFLDPIL